MRLTLINPSNPMASIVDPGSSRWNRFRVWQPLGLMLIAGLTPPGWEISIIDENLGVPDYAALPRPDLVGITAFTSQACRAYEIAACFRRDGVPVVLGGIHATMRREEAALHADAVVTGEAEGVWAGVIDDAAHRRLKPLYEGGFADMASVPPARHDLLEGRCAFGAIQTTRGCPLGCGFCSVTSFNGARFRHHRARRRRARDRPADRGHGGALRRRLRERALPHAPARDAPVGRAGGAAAHRPRRLPRGLELVHPDLPGGALPRALHARGDARDGRLLGAVLRAAADAAPGLAQPPARPERADRRGSPTSATTDATGPSSRRSKRGSAAGWRPSWRRTDGFLPIFPGSCH